MYVKYEIKVNKHRQSMCTTRRFKSNYRIENRERIPLRSAEFNRYPAEAKEAEAIRTQRPFWPAKRSLVNENEARATTSRQLE